MKPKKIIVVLFALFLCGGLLCSEAYSQDVFTKEEVVANINVKAEAIQSFSATVIAVVRKAQSSSLSTGNLVFEKPNKSIVTLLTNMTSAGQTYLSKQIMATNGQTMLHYLVDLKKVMRLHLTDKSSLPMGIELASPFHRIDMNSLVYEGIAGPSKGLSEKQHYSITGKTVKDARAVRLYFNKEFMLYQRIMYKDDGKTIASVMTFEGVKINVPTKESLFTFDIPDGVEVEDVR